METAHALTKFVDLDLVCVDCGFSFVLTAGERAFFAAKNLTDPKRCLACRAKRLAERRAQSESGERP